MQLLSNSCKRIILNYVPIQRLCTVNSITNLTAVQLIKSLKINKEKKPTQKVQNAFTIYNEIKESKNHNVINLMLKLFLDSNQPLKYLTIWNDILLLKSQAKTELSFGLLMACCINSCIIDIKHIDSCIYVLKWMKNANYILQIHDIYIRNLIGHCNTIQNLKFIHSFIDDKYITNNNIYIKTALINAYNKFQDITYAKQIVNEIYDNKQENDVIMTGSLMKAFINKSQNKNALFLYDKFPEFHNDIIRTLALSACINSNNFEKGKRIHSQIVSDGKCIDKSLKNKLINFYGRCSELDNSIDIFNSIDNKEKDIYTIGSMMQAYVDNDCNQDVLQLYDSVNVSDRNHVIYLLAIRACTNLVNYSLGKAIHAEIIDKKLRNLYLMNALIVFYGQCCDVENGLNIFNSINNVSKDIFCITSMMIVYINNNYNIEALQLYDNVLNINNLIKKDEMSHKLAIKAAHNCNNFEKGKEIHLNILGEIKDNPRYLELKNTLIDFYGYYGDISSSLNIFNSINNNIRTVVTIGTMLNVYCINNKYVECIKLFNDQLQQSGFIMNNICYSIVLKACGQCSDIKTAKYIWNNDDMKFAIDHDILSTYIDCLSRNGYLYETYELILKFEKDKTYINIIDHVIWFALLSGCNKRNDKLFGQYTFNQIKVRFSDNRDLLVNSSVLLCNIYAAHNEFETKAQIRKDMNLMD